MSRTFHKSLFAFSAWIAFQALLLVQILPAWAFDDRSALKAQAAKEGRVKSGLEEILKTGLEEWVGPVRADRWAMAIDGKNLMQSFSGIRAIVGKRAELSNEHKLIFARYGYLYARHQIKKFLKQDRNDRAFTFVLAQDPRPSGQAIQEAQIRGMQVAGRQLQVDVRFLDGGVLPTPFAEGAVRIGTELHPAQGGVIITASHNPLQWNGVKYLTAEKEPGEALVQGGVLLPVRQKAKIVRQFKQWAEAVRKDPSRAERFLAALNKEMPPPSGGAGYRRVGRTRILEHMVREARLMWRELQSKHFKRAAKEVTVVLDTNGGAAIGHYPDFLQGFGFNVVPINDVLGVPKHGLEPVGEALKDAKRALRRQWRKDQQLGKMKKAYIAVVFDYDADRGNLVLLDPKNGRVEVPTPQETALLNVALVLSREQALGKGLKEQPRLAIVAHGATSRRVNGLARSFGAKVFLTEVGEVNVLERMRALERSGYRVPVGIEGANGGTVFRGDDPEFQGDTSRNGAMTALFIGLMAVLHEPDLVGVLKNLPGEHGQGRRHFITIPWQQGNPDEVPERLIKPYQKAIEHLWQRHYRRQFLGEGFILEDGSRHPFSGATFVYTKGSKSHRSRTPARSDRWYEGGWALELKTRTGETALVWFRGSLTEGMLRVITEGQGEKAREIAQALQKLFQEVWHPMALREAKTDGGLEETSEEMSEGDEWTFEFARNNVALQEVIRLLSKEEEWNPEFIELYRLSKPGEKEGQLMETLFPEVGDEGNSLTEQFRQAVLDKFKVPLGKVLFNVSVFTRTGDPQRVRFKVNVHRAKPQAGLEEKSVLLPADEAPRHVVFVGPQAMDSPDLLDGMALVQMVYGSGKVFDGVIFARDVDQRRAIEAGLTGRGLKILEPVVDVSQYEDLRAAIAAHAQPYLNEGKEIHWLEDLAGLEEAAGFLPIGPEGLQRIRDWIESRQLEPEA